MRQFIPCKMTSILLILDLFSLLIFLITFGAHGVDIKVYKHDDFTGLVWESNSTDSCNNVLPENYKDISSIRTDTCFIAYIGSNCHPIWTKKYPAGDTIFSSDQVEANQYIVSFHICNEEEGGNQLNIDITNFFSFGNALESHKNVCSCINVPQYVQNMDKWSIDNHHNDLLAYYEPDCKEDRWNSKFIAAGRNDDSWSMQNHQKADTTTNTTYKIQSFGPVHNSTYFETSCNPFHVIGESTKYEHETTVEIGTATNADQENDQRCQVTLDRIGKLEKHIDELRQKQDLIQNDILEGIKQQHNDFEKLTDKISQLQQQFQNFTAPPKFGYQELLGG